MNGSTIDKNEIMRLTEEYGGAWGINHTRRLLQLVSLIGEGQTYDTEIVWIAAHLHDWGAYKPWALADVDHAVRSTQVAGQFLNERNCPDDLKARVLQCIEFHHRGGCDGNLESILFADADGLDFLGVVGVLRDFSKSPKDLRKGYEAARQRAVRVPPLLRLEKSHEIAAKRLDEMMELFAAFEAETFGCF